jgi:hypothetical protein
VLQELEPDCPDLRLGPDLVQPLAQRLQLVLRDLGRVRAADQSIGELLLDQVLSRKGYFNYTGISAIILRNCNTCIYILAILILSNNIGFQEKRQILTEKSSN